MVLQQFIEYEYNLWNQLTKVTKEDGAIVSYRYNGDGLLYERTENGVTTRYYNDGANIIAEAIVSGGIANHKASYLRGLGLVARIDANGNKAYYLQNGHGDVVELRDSNGNLLNDYSYDIWGNPLTVNETIDNPFRYSGELWDDTTELQYLRARWYDPSLGRFISEDSYEGDIKNPLTLNYYVYTANNPLRYIDPSGRDYLGFTAKELQEEYGFGSGDYDGWLEDAWSSLETFIQNNSPIVNWIEGIIGRTLVTGEQLNEQEIIERFEKGNEVFINGFIGLGTGGRGKLNVKGSNGQLSTQIMGKTLKLTNIQARELAKFLGFKEVTGQKVKGELVFTNGKTFITLDNTSHIGGVWKQAKTIKDLYSDKTRMGTYDALLNRIGK